MRSLSSRRFIVILAVLLCTVFTASMVMTFVDGISFAENETLQLESSLVVGHMSDIHYFPLEHCYHDVKNENYEASDFYYSMTGDTKLVLESGVVLNATIQSIIEDGKAGTAPHYFVASGDLSKNGERVALIDVANSLRYLQNEMRTITGYDDFQVFATTGNHDLYNPDGAVYSQEDGTGRLTDVVTATQFALIFAGLGYPDANLDGSDGAINLTEYMPAEYWSSSFTSGYQASKNSANVEINYYSPVLQAMKTMTDPSERLELYYQLGDDVNVLSFSAEVKKDADKGYSFLLIDSSDRTTEKVGTIVALGKNEYEQYANSSTTYIFLEDSNGKIDTSHKLTKKDNKSTIDAAFAANQHVYRATYLEHLTGGRITEDCLEWMQAFCETQTGSKTTLGEETIISVFHQNALPHFEQEDDILKDFTLYNWEYTTKRLLSMGCRYVLTGHMHASDVMTYTDAEGRTLYDFETGSCVSYSSPHRYITFERYKCNDNKLGEKTISSVHMLEDMKEIASDDVFNPANVWDQAAYNAAITAFKNGTGTWADVIASNPAFETYIIRYEYLSKLSYNEFATIDIYSRLVDRVLDHFVSERIVDTLKNAVKGLLVGEDSILPDMLSSGGEKINKLAVYLIDTIIYDLYEDGYPFDGETYDNALEYLKAIVNKFLNVEFGDDTLASTVNPANRGKMNIKDIASFIVISHAQGTEVKLCLTQAELEAEYAYIDNPANNFIETDCSQMGEYANYGFMHPLDKTYRKRMTAALKDLHEFAQSGGLVELLLNSLLEPLYYDDNSLLKTLLNYEFDFSKAINKPMHNDPSRVYMTQEDYDGIKSLFKLMNSVLPSLLKTTFDADLGKSKLESLDINHFVLDTTITELMPAVKSILAKLIGFNLTGDTFVEAVDTALHGYLTDSFYVGLGGIVDNILTAFATDVYPDVENMSDISLPYIVQPYKGFKYANQDVTYISSKVSTLASYVGAAFNQATQENGRVPSHVTAAFDTKDSSTAYVIKFYTAEDVYASFGFREAGCECIYNKVSTSRATADMSLPFIDSVSTQTFDGVTVTITTQTKPQYIPLIDLGLAALTHGRVDYEDADKNDVPYIWGDRDNASANSIIYWNVTTVKITGLSPDKEYEYDLEGVYTTSSGEKLTFSLATFSSDPNGPVRSFRIKTAKPKTETSFEFLTIADIQGMIQGMYSNSYKAVEALLADERTKNFDFILNAGDMVDSGKNFYQWGYALNTYQPLFANYAQIFTAGNHEGNTYGMTNFFDYATPTDANGDPLITDVLGGVYYSFDYANAHFVVLNTNDASPSGLGETQYNWLKNDLETTTQKWKFVLMHKSIFSGGSHSYDGEVVAMRAQLVPLFANTGVNIVFAGHDHTYTSTMLVDKDGNTTDKSDRNWVQYTGDGVLYITLGTMGTKYYEYGENPDVTPKLDADKSILHTLSSQTFGKVIVSGDTIQYVSYTYNPETNSIEMIGESKLSSEPVIYYDHSKKGLDRAAIIAIAVVVPTVAVAGAGVATLLILKKKGKLGKKTA